MNIIDYGILTVLALSTVVGMYQGFVVAVLNIAAFFVSWLAAFLFYPVVSKMLQSNTKILPTVLYYTEDPSRIPVIEYRNADINSLPGGKIGEIIENANLPIPFDSLLRNNIAEQVFNTGGQNTLLDYFNLTITNIIINIISFLLLYFIVRFVLSLVISLTNYIVRLPVLKQFDSLLGGCFGFLRGIFIVFILFALVPVVIAVLPLDFLNDYLEESLFASFFYKSNIITNIIKGVI
ncbi:MAG: CvpA family protein [Clostridia bacterium]|jgi:uncharacterized membrane protein required for colicin V production